MKYKSELIKQIVDSRGHEKSSIHYESECVETWIEESRGAYPKLCDYQSEWLSYINKIEGGGTEPPIGEFPYIALTDVTEATVDNVVPYAYKSAILKGNTLVNIISSFSFINNINTHCYININQYKLNQTYTYIIFNIPDNISQIYLGDGVLKTVWLNWTSNFKKLGSTIMTTVTCPSNYDGAKILPHFKWTDESPSSISDMKFMLIEGDYTNLDIPYFEGMQSVKMPVLTTTGKNLLNISDFKGVGVDASGYYYPVSFVDAHEYVTYHLKPNTKYTFKGTHINENEGTSTLIYRIENNGSYRTLNTSFITDSTGITKIRIGGNTYNYNSNPTKTQNMILVEESLQETYEPYKSNILTVNEDVTLRSNGDVYDELNLLTGRLTQRIDENNEVLSQEVVKTVELTVVNQDGESMPKIKPIEGTMHLSTSSDTIPPLFSGEIPVEAITQNFASFIEEE